MIRYIGVTVVLLIAAQLFGVRVYATYDPSKAVVITSPAASDALMTASDMAVNISENPADKGAEVRK